jgi:hypothetical protein
MVQQEAQRLAAAALYQNVLPLVRVLLDKMLRQERNILHAFTQWREMDVDDVETVEKVFPENAALARDLEVAVRRSDEPEVHADLAHSADTHDLPFLQYAQDLGLEERRHIADLIEEHGSAVGLLQKTLLGVLRAGERSLFETEEL